MDAYRLADIFERGHHLVRDLRANRLVGVSSGHRAGGGRVESTFEFDEHRVEDRDPTADSARLGQRALEGGS